MCNDVSRALAALDTIAIKRRKLEQQERQLIGNARAVGATWKQIAQRLGYKDRQGAQLRYKILARSEQKEEQPCPMQGQSSSHSTS